MRFTKLDKIPRFTGSDLTKARSIIRTADPTVDLSSRARLCPVLLRLSTRPSQSICFGDVSEANARGKPRQKQTAHAFVLFFKMADFTGKNVNVNVIYLPTKHQRALGTRSKVSVRSRSNWKLEMLVFVEGGKPEYS